MNERPANEFDMILMIMLGFAIGFIVNMLVGVRIG